MVLVQWYVTSSFEIYFAWHCVSIDLGIVIVVLYETYLQAEWLCLQVVVVSSVCCTDHLCSTCDDLITDCIINSGIIMGKSDKTSDVGKYTQFVVTAIYYPNLSILNFPGYTYTYKMLFLNAMSLFSVYVHLYNITTFGFSTVCCFIISSQTSMQSKVFKSSNLRIHGVLECIHWILIVLSLHVKFWVTKPNKYDKKFMHFPIICR